MSAVDSPLDIQTIQENQKEDTELLARKDKHSDYYFEKKIGEFPIICYSKDSDEQKTKWRIALPKICSDLLSNGFILSQEILVTKSYN